MKSSKFLLSTLVAAAAMTSSAYAATPSVDAEDSTKLSYSGSVNQMLPGDHNTSDYTLTFNVTDGYFADNRNGNKYTFYQNIVIEQLTSNNGYGEAVTTFTGKVTGNGEFKIYNKGLAQDFVFTGNVTGYSGEINSSQSYNATEKGLEGTNSGILQFGAVSATTYSSGATATDGVVKNISGTGTISTTSVLRYNYTGAADETSSLGINNSSISARYLEFKGGADYIVDSALSGRDATAANNTLEVSAGSATFNAAVSKFGNVIVASDAEAVFNGTTTLYSAVANSGKVTFTSEATVVLDNLTGVLVDNYDKESSGVKLAGATYTIVSGGTASGLSDATFRLNEETVSGTVNATDSAVTVEDALFLFYVKSGNTVDVAEISGVSEIVVDGKLTGLKKTGETAGTSNVSVPVSGRGVVQIDNAGADFQYYNETFLESFAGEVVVNSGTVKLGENAGSKLANISSLKLLSGGALSFWKGTFARGINLAGGEISAGGNIGISGEVNVSAASTIDTKANTLTISGNVVGDELLTKKGTGSLILSGTATLKKVSIEGGTLTISGKVVGDELLTKKGTGSLILSGTATLKKVSIEGGTLRLNSTASNYTDVGTRFNIDNLTMESGTTLETVGQGFVFDSVTVADNNATATMKLLDLSGVKTQTVAIKELSGTNATLNLVSTVTMSSAKSAVFTLGDKTTTGSGFSGTILVDNEATGTRKSTLVIANENIARNATIYFAEAGTHGMGLGINAERVVIAGLKSDQEGTGTVSVFSGDIGNNENFVSDGTPRTLVIDTDTTEDHTFYGSILANVNLEKSGTGTQTLAGASADFNGSVLVKGGVLVAAHASALGTGTVEVSGGQLEVADGVMLNQTSISVVLNEAYTSSYAITSSEGEVPSGKLTVGTTISVSGDLSALETTTYYISNIGGEVFLDDDFEVLLKQKNWEYKINTEDNSITFTASVPEPSAFGLLAGIGALALVASRRRRK